MRQGALAYAGRLLNQKGGLADLRKPPLLVHLRLALFYQA